MSRLDRELSKVYKNVRFSFILVGILLAILYLGMSYRIIDARNEINDLKAQVAGLRLYVDNESTARCKIEAKTILAVSKHENILDRIITLMEGYSSHQKWIDARLDEFNNACNLYCSRSSADYFVLISKIDLLQETSDRHEQLIAGAYHNFSVIWPWLEGIDTGLASMSAKLYNRPKPCSSIQRKPCRRR